MKKFVIVECKCSFVFIENRLASVNKIEVQLNSNSITSLHRDHDSIVTSTCEEKIEF